MPDFSLTAFQGFQKIAQGSLAEVAIAVAQAQKANPDNSFLVFDDSNGAVVDLDPRGLSDPPGLPAQEPQRGRGRPKLGVVAREITLLPRHWDWLAMQPGGASHALRRLVDAARKADGGLSAGRQARDAAYRFMAGIAGDLPGFEEASRALFADDRDGFLAQTGAWPQDVRRHAATMAWGGDAA